MSGTVQLPPDGNPVILLAEHQTTGGYSVPAVVIQAGLYGQMGIWAHGHMDAWSRDRMDAWSLGRIG